MGMSMGDYFDFAEANVIQRIALHGAWRFLPVEARGAKRLRVQGGCLRGWVPTKGAESGET